MRYQDSCPSRAVRLQDTAVDPSATVEASCNSTLHDRAAPAQQHCLRTVSLKHDMLAFSESKMMNGMTVRAIHIYLELIQLAAIVAISLLFSRWRSLIIICLSFHDS